MPISDSPRKQKRDSHQNTQKFLKQAKLLDARDERQQLFFLEHDWTVARALKVRFTASGMIRMVTRGCACLHPGFGHYNHT